MQLATSSEEDNVDPGSGGGNIGKLDINTNIEVEEEECKVPIIGGKMSWKKQRLDTSDHEEYEEEEEDDDDIPI